MTAQVWHPFDYEDRVGTAPPIEDFVWVYDRYYEGVTLGYWNGYEMCTLANKDDCSISHWMHLTRPAAPRFQSKKEGIHD